MRRHSLFELHAGGTWRAVLPPTLSPFAVFANAADPLFDGFFHLFLSLYLAFCC
jgi:hypothetical protein